MTKITKVETKDGSVTFHNLEFDETYHSISGAKEEAMLKFVGPCKIKELALTVGKVKILDFCFGLGYNSAAAIEACLNINPECKVEIVGLENDETIINAINEVDNVFDNYNLIKELAKKDIVDGVKEYLNGNITIKLIMGDALNTVNLLDDGFDAVFFDPFSPKKCPWLWSSSVFSSVFKVMKNGGILATYSCARTVRDNLASAGFKVFDGPIVGRRAPSTIAVKN